jgi:hypothetical protein
VDGQPYPRPAIRHCCARSESGTSFGSSTDFLAFDLSSIRHPPLAIRHPTSDLWAIRHLTSELGSVGLNGWNGWNCWNGSFFGLGLSARISASKMAF